MLWRHRAARLSEPGRGQHPVGRVAVEAAEPLGVPVFPALVYGLTPYFREYPGTISQRETYMRLIRDILTGWAERFRQW